MKTCVTCKHYSRHSEKCLNKKLSDQDPVKGGYYYYYASTNRSSCGGCGPSGKYHETKDLNSEKLDKPPEVKDIITGPKWTYTEVIVTFILIGIVAFSLYQIKYL